jgi:hypothetical protein
MADKISVAPDGTLISGISIGNIYSNPSWPAYGTPTYLSAGGTLLPGGYYTYYVTSINTFGESTAGGGLVATVPAGTNTNQIVLNWIPVVGSSGYKIYGRMTGQPDPPTFTTAAGGSLTPSTTYYYRITSTNGSGESPASTEASFATTSSNKTININWNRVLGATGYKVYGRTTGAELLLATVSSGTTLTWADDGTVTPSGAIPIYNTTGLGIFLMATINDGRVSTWTDNGSIVPSGAYNQFDQSSYFHAEIVSGSAHWGYQAVSRSWLFGSTAFGQQANGSGQNVGFGYRSGSSSTGTVFSGAESVTVGAIQNAVGGCAIGYASAANNAVTVGNNSSTVSGVAVGHNIASASGTSIGSLANAFNGIAIGNNASCYPVNYSTALGVSASPVRFGELCKTIDWASPMKNNVSAIAWYGVTTSGTQVELTAFTTAGQLIPTITLLTTSNTGGTLTPGTYAYRAAWTSNYGVGLACTEQTIVVPAGTNTNSVTINWSLPSNPGISPAIFCGGVYIYGRTSGSEGIIGAINVSPTSMIDTGSGTPSSLPVTIDSFSPRMQIKDYSAAVFKISVTARDDAADALRGWEIKGVIIRGSGLGTTAMSTTSSNTWGNGSGTSATWDCSVVADSTIVGGFRILVTGAASTTIMWDAKGELCEVKQ